MHDGCAAPGYIQRAQWEGCSQDSLFFFLLQIFSEIIHLTWYESRVRNRICSARSRPRLCLCDPGVRILSEPTLLTHNEEDLHAVAVLLTEDLLKKLFCPPPPQNNKSNESTHNANNWPIFGMFVITFINYYHRHHHQHYSSSLAV